MLHQAVADLHRRVVVGVSRDDVHVREVGEQLVEHRRVSVGHRRSDVERRVVVEHLAVGADHQRGVLVLDGRQVGFQPRELHLREGGVVGVVARSPGRGVGPGVEVDRVVEHDEVRLADVERIVGRPEVVLVGLFGRVVVVGVFVVVVVARDVVDQGRDGRVLERVGVVAQVVLVRIPVEVEGHVADVHDVDLSRRSGDVVLHLGKHQLLVLGDVAQTVGQVDVGQHQQVEIILSRGLDQLEIDLFARLLAGGHRAPDQGHGVFRQGFVARRHAHEDVAVVFLRGEVVAARVVGRGDDLAVGDDHARDGQRAAEDHALDVHALLVGDFDVEAAAEFEDAQHLALPPAVHDEEPVGISCGTAKVT